MTVLSNAADKCLDGWVQAKISDFFKRPYGSADPEEYLLESVGFASVVPRPGAPTGNYQVTLRRVVRP